jgi:hypothetical protein
MVCLPQGDHGEDEAEASEEACEEDQQRRLLDILVVGRAVHVRSYGLRDNPHPLKRHGKREETKTAVDVVSNDQVDADPDQHEETERCCEPQKPGHRHSCFNQRIPGLLKHEASMDSIRVCCSPVRNL